MASSPKIAIVGPCSSGKSSLRQALHTAGYTNVRNPAQEHSYVPAMWQKLVNPDLLIYLDVDYPAAVARRPRSTGSPDYLAEQKRRLAHARQHAHFYIDTSPHTPEQVSEAVLKFLATLPTG